MREPPHGEPVRRALELLGWRVEPVAPGLLRACRVSLRHGTAGLSPAAQGAAVTVALDPAWLARVPGAMLAAPGTAYARQLWKALAQRGRTATLVYAPPGTAGPLRRSLCFRFLLTVRGFALVEGVRRFVIDVWARSESETACCPPAPGRAGWAYVGAQAGSGPGPPPALRWVSPYEIGRLGQAALEAAAEQARRHVAELRRGLDALRRRERLRVERYFDERAAEEAARVAGWVERASAAALYAQVGAAGEVGEELRRRASRLAAAVRLRQRAAQRALAALRQEREAALAEVDGRFEVRARLVPAGIAVVWHRPG